MTNAIETNHLHKTYGGKVAVSDLTLQVKPGEVFGFLGPNGAGKTTSIKMLLSLVTPTSGDGTILGAPLGDAAIRAQIGYLPEHFRFHTWLKAWEFLDFHGKMFGIERSRRREIIPDLLELVGLGDRIHTKLAAFSKGMTQRIGLAQALMNDPKLVLLDEPTSGLDPLGRKLMRDIIDGLRNEGTAVFINSHLLSEIEQTCDRVAFIREGTVLEVNDMSTLNQAKTRIVLRTGAHSPDLVDALDQFSDHIEVDRSVATPLANGHIVLTTDLEAGDSQPRHLARRQWASNLRTKPQTDYPRRTIYSGHQWGKWIRVIGRGGKEFSASTNCQLPSTVHMSQIWNIATLTIREGQRRRIVQLAIIMGILFLIVFGTGMHYIFLQFEEADAGFIDTDIPANAPHAHRTLYRQFSADFDLCPYLCGIDLKRNRYPRD